MGETSERIVVESETARAERGFVFVVLVASIIPMLFLAGAAIMSMQGRNTRLIDEINQERAFWAAESGIDEAVYQASLNQLKDGVPISRTIGNHGSFVVQPTLLLNDGQDNDGDGYVDEADENVFRLIVTGTYRSAVRRLVAYMGPTPGLPPLQAAASIQGIPKEIEIQHNAVISGFDVTPPDIVALRRSRSGSGGGGTGTGLGGGSDSGSGSSGGGGLAHAATNAPGLATTSADPIMDLGMYLKINDFGQVTGVGGSPSLAGGAPKIDLVDLINKLRSSADVVLTKKKVTSPTNLGDASKGDYKIIFRNGKLDLKGPGRGAGILVVTGKVELKNGFRFDGLILAMGKIEVKKNSVVNGGVILGPDLGDFNDKKDDKNDMKLEVEHFSKIQYSSTILRQVGFLLPGRYVVFNGWQEIARN